MAELAPLTASERKWAKTLTLLDLIEQLASRNGALEAEVHSLKKDVARLEKRLGER